MFIPRAQVQGLLQVYGKNNQNTVNKIQSLKPPAGNDALSISGESKIKQRAMLAVKQSSDMHIDKVNDLKERISAGTYTVSNDEVAEKIIAQAMLDRFV